MATGDEPQLGGQHPHSGDEPCLGGDRREIKPPFHWPTDVLTRCNDGSILTMVCPACNGIVEYDGDMIIYHEEIATFKCHDCHRTFAVWEDQP